MILFSTHHRSGTVLTRNMLQYISRNNKHCLFQKLDNKSQLLKIQQGSAQSLHVFQNTHGYNFPQVDIQHRDVHLIRNPYDLLLSHINYHSKSESPLEACNKLMVNGVTYRDYINSLSTLNQKAEFEINGIFGRTFRRMLDYDYSCSNSIHLLLEEFKPKYAKITSKSIYSHLNQDIISENEILDGIQNSNRIFKSIAHGTTKERQDNKGTSKELFSDYIIEVMEKAFPEIGSFESFCDARAEAIQ